MYVKDGVTYASGDEYADMLCARGEAEMYAQSEETALLRGVYEAARRVLRFNGVDAGAVQIALIDMDMAIERVKLLDSGQG